MTLTQQFPANKNYLFGEVCWRDSRLFLANNAEGSRGGRDGRGEAELIGEKPTPPFRNTRVDYFGRSLRTNSTLSLAACKRPR